MKCYVQTLFLQLLVLWAAFLPGTSSAESRLNFALLVFNGEQRNAYLQQVQAFEKEYPSIQVNIQALESEQYKQKIESWLAAPSHSDVMFWFGGERLNWYIAKGWVAALDDLWLEGDWYNRITQSAQSSVLRNGRVYGLPIHYYPWGIYYKKALFEKLKVQVPDDWDSMLKACEVLKKHKVTPIALGSSEAWPLAGWFDYLNLRINGLDFHQQLMSGEVSYRDTRVKAVFTHWQELIDGGCFLAGHESKSWREALPYLYRDLAGMFLMGNFWTSQIPSSYREQFSLFRFPAINKELPFYEEAPTDVLFMPSNVVNIDAAKLFLGFMARPSVQEALNASLGMLPPQVESPRSGRKDHFLAKGVEILGAAEGASQFYDRDNPQPIAIEGIKQMQRFVSNPSALPDILNELEGLRAESFNQ